MRLSAVVLTCCVSLSASADEMTLPAAIALARQQAPDYLAAQERVRAALGQQAQASLWFRSNPELSGDWIDDRLFGNEGERRAGVELTQEIEIAGQPGLRGAAAEFHLGAVQADAAASG